MHELSIAQALVEQLQQALVREGATRLVRVRVAVGALAGVDPDALEFSFPLVAEDTPVAGAKLELRPVALRVKCRACGMETEPDRFWLRCGGCAGDDVEITQGRGLYIEEIELPD